MVVNVKDKMLNNGISIVVVELDRLERELFVLECGLDM